MSNVYTYWDGEKPPIIDLCLQSLKLHNPELIVYTPETIDPEVFDFVDTLPRPIRSDYIRAYLGHSIGGTWIDADSIGISPLTLVPKSSELELICVNNPYLSENKILSTPYYTKNKSEIAKEIFDRIKSTILQMKNGKKITYGTTSTGILSDICLQYSKEKEKRVFVKNHWRYNPVHWKIALERYAQKKWKTKDRMSQDLVGISQHETSGSWNPNAELYHLTGKVINHFSSMSKEQILSDNTFLSFLFQKSFTLPPAIPNRSISILERIPKKDNIVGVEIGVNEGYNAACLLQQRKNLSLYCIDPYQMPQENGQLKLQQALDRTVKFSNRVFFQLVTSETASKAVAKNSLDFAFIDGNHSKESVSLDLELWNDKIKNTGWLGGHDYSDNFPGVKIAVDEFMKKRKNLKIEFGLDTTYFITTGKK